MAQFEHPALSQTNNIPLVYTAMSKHLFYFRMHISKFVIEQNAVPLNPFMILEYFLLDTVDRNHVRTMNNTIVKRSDEIWVFGPVSNGVLAEVQLAKSTGKPVRYFAVRKSTTIEEIQKEAVEMEDEVKEFRDML